MSDFTRREFFKLSTASVGALSIGCTNFGQKKNVGESAVKRSYCDICYWHCGIKIKVEKGRVVKISGDENDPISRGKLCARGQAGIQRLYNPDRLKTPLISTGKRGEGKFREASWKEALDYSAEKLLAVSKKWGGPEAIAWLCHCSCGGLFGHIAGAMGSPHSGGPAHALCIGGREIASKLTFGRPIGEHMPVDWENAKFIVLIGNHIGENSHNTLMQDFIGALDNGAKLVVVDPRLSTAAGKADWWLPIKPGTDTALLLAWMNVIITEELYDKEYVEKYALGFDELKNHIAEYTPQWAAPITEIKADTIIQIAREMAKYGHRAVIPPNRHVAWYGNDTQRLRALFILNTLLGNYGREGGFYFAANPWVGEYEYPPSKVAGAGGGCGGGSGKLGSDTLPDNVRPRVDGRNEKFLFGGLVEPELFKAIASGKPYPVKGLVVAGTNLFHSMPDVPGVKKALHNLDFYLCVDILPQEHVLWADVILPDTTYLERYGDLHSVPHKTTPFISFREPAVEPLYDTKPGWWIARELGIRLGLEEYFPWKNYEEYLTTRLDSLGITLEQIKKDGVIKQPQLSKPYIKDYESQGEALPFNTPSGKIEIYSEMLKEAGKNPLPTFEETAEPPKGYFRLLYGRSPVHSFSRTQSNRWLSKIMPENEVWVNAKVAAKLGIRHGEYVILENKEGTKSNRIKVKVTERIRSDCVYMVHGFGHNTPGLKRQHKKGASDVALQSHYNLDPISGSCGLHVNFVKINKNGGIV